MTLYKTPRFFRILFPKKTWSFPFSGNCVYLTFDDGPDPEITSWILDLLEKENIKATFFCVGENVKRNPELTLRILTNGHSMGNHSMRHENGKKTNFHDYINSIDEAGKYINSKLFRPPYGRMTLRQTKEVSKKYKIIMWTWLSYDFDKNISVEKILLKAKNQISMGDILVFHDNKKSMERLKLLLPEVIRIVRKKGLEFKPIQE